MGNNELISFKGMVDGVRINLNASAGIFELIEALEQRIAESKAFFGDGDCRISFGGRQLSASEKQRLQEIMKKILPMSRVEFDSDKPKTISHTDWVEVYKDRNKEAEAKEPETSGEARTETAIKEPDTDEFISVLRSSRARFYEGTLKEGMMLDSDGHLVLLGSVCEGAELVAAGNIIVIGGLYGTAHAGCNGHNGSYIMAMDMRPEGLAIARTAEMYTYPEEQNTEPEPSSDKKTFFDKLRKKPEIDEQEQEKPDNNPISAVALLKNNKITVDNFTLEDFTNLKNMV